MKALRFKHTDVPRVRASSDAKARTLSLLPGHIGVFETKCLHGLAIPLLSED
jgi:hypothetical protein